MPRGWGRHDAWSRFDFMFKAGTAHSLRSDAWSYPVTRLAAFGLSDAFDNWDAINAQSLGQPIQACAPARACRHEPLGMAVDGRGLVHVWSTTHPVPSGQRRGGLNLRRFPCSQVTAAPDLALPAGGRRFESGGPPPAMVAELMHDPQIYRSTHSLVREPTEFCGIADFALPLINPTITLNSLVSMAEKHNGGRWRPLCC